MNTSVPRGALPLPVLPSKCAPGLKLLSPVSTSVMVSWPPVTRLPSLPTFWSSVTAPVPLLSTGTSLVPMMVTVTWCVALPSAEVTVNCSVSVWPAPSACTAASPLFRW
ncbi:hypothetical protein BOBR111200_25945 [Bordetella bronchialis]